MSGVHTKIAQRVLQVHCIDAMKLHCCCRWPESAEPMIFAIFRLSSKHDVEGILERPLKLLSGEPTIGQEGKYRVNSVRCHSIISKVYQYKSRIQVLISTLSVHGYRSAIVPFFLWDKGMKIARPAGIIAPCL